MNEDPKKVHAPVVEDKHGAFVRLVDKLPANERAAALVRAQRGDDLALFVLRHRITDIGQDSALVKRVGLIWTLESPDGNRRRTVAVDETRFDFARLEGVAPHTDLRALVAPGATIEGTRFIAELPSPLEYGGATWERLSWEGPVKLAVDDLWVRDEDTTTGESAKPALDHETTPAAPAADPWSKRALDGWELAQSDPALRKKRSDEINWSAVARRLGFKNPKHAAAELKKHAPKG